MKAGGDGASRATHVRLMSLPLLIKTSLLPSISARDTGKTKVGKSVIEWLRQRRSKTTKYVDKFSSFPFSPRFFADGIRYNRVNKPIKKTQHRYDGQKHDLINESIGTQPCWGICTELEWLSSSKSTRVHGQECQSRMRVGILQETGKNSVWCFITPKQMQQFQESIFAVKFPLALTSSWKQKILCSLGRALMWKFKSGCAKYIF